jgi:PAS domain S-box-containing protein
MTVLEPAIETTPCRAPARGRHVLLVDDDPTQLKLVRAHLRAAGFDVTTAASAGEALEAARQHRPDAVVSDVRMSELDGFMLCSVLRADPQVGAVPIVLITAHVEDNDFDFARSAGAHTLVERSPQFDRELRALESALDDSTAAAWQPDPVIRQMAGRIGHLLVRCHETASRYRTLVNSASEAISVTTLDGVILEVNHRWEEILGVSRDQVVGHPIRDFAPSAESYPQDGHCPAGPDRHDSTPIVHVVRPDGTFLYMEFSSKVVRIGRESVVLAIGRDVTERVEARRVLAASEEKYRALLESIPDVVWSATSDGRRTFISPNVAKLCGFTPEDVLRAPSGFWLDRVHEEDRERIRAAFQSLYEGRAGLDVEYRWRRRDGAWVALHDRAVIRHSANGVRDMDGLISDVTERKRLEEQVQLSQKMEAIGQLTGGIAHDFNNILSVILLNGDFLRDALPESDPRRADADAICEASQRAAALTRQLLSFSRREVIEPRDVNLNHCVTSVEKMLRRVIGEDIDLDVVLDADLGDVHADPGQLEQVLMNLAVNARDAMPRGGRLSIETASTWLDEAQARGGAPGEYVVLAVSDTGCGMSAAVTARIFEPFFTTKALGYGTGLGLATCYGIVKQSGGSIAVYSEPGHGSVFKVYLPRVATTASRRTPDNLSTSVPGGTETILLIEDDASLRTMVCRTLKALGYQVLAATDGADALTLARNAGGDLSLVLSDIVMPDMPGPDLVARIRRDCGPLKVLFRSGYTEHAVLRDQFLRGAANFIQKPFAPSAMARKIRAVIDMPAGRA